VISHDRFRLPCGRASPYKRARRGLVRRDPVALPSGVGEWRRVGARFKGYYGSLRGCQARSPTQGAFGACNKLSLKLKFDFVDKDQVTAGRRLGPYQRTRGAGAAGAGAHRIMRGPPPSRASRSSRRTRQRCRPPAALLRAQAPDAAREPLRHHDDARAPLLQRLPRDGRARAAPGRAAGRCSATSTPLATVCVDNH
jgi:hypothetical protein